MFLAGRRKKGMPDVCLRRSSGMALSQVGVGSLQIPAQRSARRTRRDDPLSVRELRVHELAQRSEDWC